MTWQAPSNKAARPSRLHGMPRHIWLLHTRGMCCVSLHNPFLLFLDAASDYSFISGCLPVGILGLYWEGGKGLLTAASLCWCEVGNF